MKLFIIQLLFCCFCFSLHGQNQKVWLDADTGNEMDDLYAIARLVKEPSIQLIGLSSVHFNNVDLLTFETWNGYQTKDLVTVQESQLLNEQLLASLGRLDIVHPLGADRQIGRAWGQEDPRPSYASTEIIKAVKALKAGEKLDIITLGALTNIATALIIAPEIADRIRCYSLGAKYNPATNIWNKSEFNIRNDLNAFDYLLNKKDFNLTIMPLEAAFPLQFQREETYAKLNDTIAIEKILKVRWQEHNPQDLKRVMWDLALVEAYLNPKAAVMIKTNTPPENTQRKIFVYTKIQQAELTKDFWDTLIK